MLLATVQDLIVRYGQREREKSSKRDEPHRGGGTKGAQ
jgi:hypothetical protein